MLLEETAKAAQWWESLLYASGGKLELDKCFFYLIYWEFDGEGLPRLLQPEEFPMDVMITDSATNIPVNITAKSSLEAHKTLGAMECPSGDNSAEVTRLYGKAKGLGQRIATAGFSASEATLLCRTRVDPAMGYLWAVGTLSEQQANKIQGLVVHPLLQAMGFNSCTLLAVVYAPQELGGIGMRHFFSEQGTCTSCSK
jgi:hypothetical protein